MRIFISGSIAYDYILDYPGFFADHINPGKAHVLSVSFWAKNVRRNIGGTAGNIAFNLSMLDAKTEIIAAAGKNDKNLKKDFERFGVGTKYLRISKTSDTATAYIMTDKADNQISGFHPGAMMEQARLPKLEPCDWPIIAAENSKNMAAFARHYQKTKNKYIFDPGQAITALSKQELRTCFRGASIVIGNDYEIDFIKNRLTENKRPLRFGQWHCVTVRTLGHKGSEIIFPNGKKVKIGTAKTKSAVDPTGAGDAYRAGLIKGIISGLDIKRCAQLGATAAVFAVEKYGTQNHRFDYGILVKRHNKNFKDKI